MTRIGLIHALAHSVAPINDALARDWPDALRMNLLDDSLSADLAAGGGLDARMHARFEQLASYAFESGCDAHPGWVQGTGSAKQSKKARCSGVGGARFESVDVRRCWTNAEWKRLLNSHPVCISFLQ